MKMPKCLVELGVREIERIAEGEIPSDDVLKQIDMYGFDEREVWDIAYSSARWLYLHVRLYCDLSDDDIYLSENKFRYCDIGREEQKYTLRDSLNKILEYLADYIIYMNTESIVESYTEEEELKVKEKLSKAFEIYGKVVNSMWW